MYLPEKFSHKPSKDAVYFGIDLGTTYSLVATVDSKEVNKSNITKIPVKFISYRQVSPIRYGGEIQDEKVASIIAFYDGKPYCGSKLYELKGHEGFVRNRNIFYHWKLDFGIDRHPLYPDAVSDDLNTPAKVAAKLLNFCRIGYTNNRDQKLYNTVVTVPASFQMNQRRDVIYAAESAKIELSNKMLIDEPNAAFIGYFNAMLDTEKENFIPVGEESKRVLVFDIGGGTCDLSILEISYTPSKGLLIGNKAISRYNDLGGQDIDMLIAEEILYPKFLEEFGISDDMPYKDLSDIILPQLATIGEMLKIGICNLISSRYTTIDLKDAELNNTIYTLEGRKVIYKGKQHAFKPLSISGAKFEQLIGKLFQRFGHSFKYQDKVIRSVSKTIDETLEKANLNKHDIDVMLMVGGSSNNPVLTKKLHEISPKSQFWIPPNPDLLVAEGAAIYSFFYYHFDRSLINAISSETIGVEVRGGTFYPLIERGTELPIKIEVPNFRIQSATQKELTVPICLNSKDFLVQEIKIPLNGIYAGDEVVTVKVEIDTNKVMQIEVFIEDDKIINYKIENPFFFGALSKEQVKFVQLTENLDKARRSGDNNSQKRLMRNLLSQYYEIKNYHEMARIADEYLEKYDNDDSHVLNYSYIGNKNIGRLQASKKALRKALDLDPNCSALNYNYSLTVEEVDGKRKALDYLDNLSDSLKNSGDIRCRVLILKSQLGINVNQEAAEIVDKYHNSPSLFSKFEVENLLSKIHSLADVPFNKRSSSNQREKENSLLVPPSTPIIKN